MFPLRRSSSFLAYTYESDDEKEGKEDDDEDCCSLLCGCQDDMDESEGDHPMCMDETTRLVPSVTSRKKLLSTTKRSRKRIRDLRLVGAGSIAIIILMLLVHEYSILLVPVGEDPFIAETFVMASAENHSLSSLATATATKNNNNNTASTTTNVVQTTTTTEYGEVWLIRHAEKETPAPFDSDETQEQRWERILAMYELSPGGWDRAHHLSSLVSRGEWPLFSALFASRPATREQVRQAYPDFARDATGQSLVWREYQTLVPLAEYLQTTATAAAANAFRRLPSNETITIIRTHYAKGDVEEAALEIAKTAISSSSVLGRSPREPHRGGYKNNNHNDGTKSSAVVLVSWDHCSLPTLVVKGFGCRSSQWCYRCWPDDRFGDVMKLNVSLVITTTTTTTKPIATEPKEKSIENSTDPLTDEIEDAKIVSHDYQVSSTILGMTGEAYPVDDYFRDLETPNRGGSTGRTQTETSSTRSARTPMSIEQSSPCTPSYCTGRPAAKDLVRCSCWEK